MLSLLFFCGIVLINETPLDPEGPEAESLCSWWRWSRVELHQQHGLAVLVAIRSAVMVANGGRQLISMGRS